MQPGTTYSALTTDKPSPDETVESRSFELLLTEIAAGFVNLPSTQIDQAIVGAQKDICDHLCLDRSVLWQTIDEVSREMRLTHIHGAAENLPPVTTFDTDKTFPWVWGQLLQGQHVIVKRLEDLPPEAGRDLQSFRRWEVKSSCLMPLSAGGKIIGALSFCTLSRETRLHDQVVERLRLAAQIFSNALSRKKTEKMLYSRQRFEELVTDISTRFINLPAERIDTQIEDAQRLICDSLSLDLSSLWQWSEEEPRALVLTHLHSPPPPDGPERPEHLEAHESFPWKLEQLLNGNLVAVNTEELPPEAHRDKESHHTFGIKSSIGIPLSTGGGSLIGVLSFEDLKKKRSWPEPIVKRLRMVAQIFANAIARKRWEQELCENEARLNMATDAAGVGLWALDIDSGYLWASEKTRELFHFEQDEALNFEKILEAIHPSDHQKVEDILQTAIQAGGKQSIEYRIVLPDGSTRWISSSGKRLLGCEEKPVRMIGASIDVTHRKQMETQLRKQLKEIKDLKQKLEEENIVLRKEIELQYAHEEIISRSPEMHRILTQVEQVARTDATVLIEGETGTGKELLARAVHRLSNRKNRPLITVNCASLPPTLVESELFGREKGAYTGALTRMAGRFEMADKATLFLDEIGELPLDVQAKLLRVLEQGRFERLGSTKSIRVDVRIIAATNLDLARQVAAGRFRKDLYFRLNVFPINLPPLRNRSEDIPPLVWHFVRQFEADMGRRINEIPRHCMEHLQRYAWPGNIRELKNVIERAMITSSDGSLHLQPPNGDVAQAHESLDLEEAERKHIRNVLQQTGWRLSGRDGAAEILGLKRTTLYSKMKKLGIQRPPH